MVHETVVNAGARIRDPRLTAAGILLLVIAAMLGCEAEPARVKVEGQVMLDGLPLDAGEIQFVPTKGRAASASIGSDGRFNLTSAPQGDPNRVGVIPGEYRVAVSTVQIVDDETVTWLAPQKYGNHLTSGIEVDIDRSTDSLLIVLSSEVNDTVEDQQAKSKDTDLQRKQVEPVAELTEGAK